MKEQFIGTFENYIQEKGYLKYILDTKQMKFTNKLKPRTTLASSSHTLDFRYIPKTDVNLLNKIENGLSVMDEISCEDRKNVICYGFNEHGKPPTLISPRPKIEIKRMIDGDVVFENEVRDDSMNVVLAKIPFEEIFKAMYDNSIVFKIDLT